MIDTASFLRRYFQKIGHDLPLGPLFDYLPDVCFYVKDLDSRFVKANRTLYSLFGANDQERIVGKSDLDFDFIPRHMAEHYMDEDRQVMHDRVVVSHRVCVLSGKDRIRRWYVGSKIPLLGKAGKVVGIAGVMHPLHDVEQRMIADSDMQSVAAHVLNHYGNRLEVRQLAQMANLSLSQFDRRFKQLYHMTPQQYILQVRIKAACDALVATSDSVSDIALRTGFYDQSYFTKQFRKRMGMTPLAYRKHYQGGEGKDVER